MTPEVPTPLVEVRVQARRGPGVPDVVLVGQSSPAQSRSGQSTTDDPLILGPGADELGVDEHWLAQYRVTAAAGSVQVVPLAAARPDHGWLVGIGQGSAGHWRAAGAALVRATSARVESEVVAGRGVSHLAPRVVQVHLPPGTTSHQAASLALGCVVGSHRYCVSSGGSRIAGSAGGSRIAGSAGSSRIAGSAGSSRIAGSAGGQPPRMTTVALIAPTGDELGPLAEAVARAQVLGRATGLARDLANTPSGHKDPAWLASTAARLAATVPGLRATVRNEHWLAEHGFGGVLAVGGGSARPPRLLELAWQPHVVSRPKIGPKIDTEEHLVLVGKGITFDTGGISIKPADGMHLMRTDMSGGAAVIATLLAVGQLKLPLRVTGLVPCAENHVSGSALRPSDVVRHVGGITTEVTNTDAEGRLVLADALAYAVRTLAPTTLVDVATLTGAMKVSLGLRTGGLFATEPELAERIRAAGEATGEPWWPMPLIDDHAGEIRSDIADLRQCPPGPGGITAALFLREFTGGLPWAHLDIAGPARAEQSYDEVNAGGTGFAARTLIELACSFTS
ncbi:MAG: M17 family metallopeptidase [Actinomycetota bacterium]|nr:M17 family metallopeptidase [Actinomycetota bacterium]